MKGGLTTQFSIFHCRPISHGGCSCRLWCIHTAKMYVLVRRDGHRPPNYIGVFETTGILFPQYQHMKGGQTMQFSIFHCRPISHGGCSCRLWCIHTAKMYVLVRRDDHRPPNYIGVFETTGIVILEYQHTKGGQTMQFSIFHCRPQSVTVGAVVKSWCIYIAKMYVLVRWDYHRPPNYIGVFETRGGIIHEYQHIH
jgi:hypothetical protein